ncbi:MAG: phage shock protein PspC (stress-responsive transcriptional regulator) [Crocinitomicaceae bacterium]|jgi:phage shock protein PspC (stress-responsive transcriptional regulator)
MKKTVSVNIKGTNFLIEEDAYELLQDYLDRLTQALKNDEGGSEIVEDVELRIAEICSSKLSDSKTVIELKDIQDILSALGDPADFVDGDGEPTPESTVNNESKSSNSNGDRRLFRDGESATIGGVCAGIANYFGVDVVIIRAIFVVFFLFAGFGFPLYILLWIIIPKATSTIDKLRMKGQPITVESVKTEVENASEKIKSGSKSIVKKYKDVSNYNERLARGKRVITALLGIGFIGFGILNLIGFLVFIISGFEILPIHGENGWMSVTDFGELVLSNPSDVSLAWMGGLMIWLSAILFMIIAGSLLLFRIKNTLSKYVLSGLVVIGITGIVICSVVGMRTGKDFTFKRSEPGISATSSKAELVIIPRLSKYRSSMNHNFQEHDGPSTNLEVGNKNIKSFGLDIQYVPSSDTLFHIHQKFSARAKSPMAAFAKAKRVKHNMELINDTLYVDVHFTYPKTDKLRDQRVTLIIEIPEGRTVRYQNRIIQLGSEDVNQNIDHPYYKKQGRIRGDGSYHYYEEGESQYIDGGEFEREIKEEILEELKN